MVTVFLKINYKERVDFVLKNLNFWLGLFSDADKYEIIIYNENVPLPPQYNAYNIMNRANLMHDPLCAKIANLIPRTKISSYWVPATLPLFASYIYSGIKNNIVLNIDACDMQLIGNATSYIDQAIDYVQSGKSPFLSWDLHYSYHFPPGGDFRKHHLSFGLNVGNREVMKDYVMKAMFLKTTETPPWNGVNADYIIDLVLENTKYEKLAFIAPEPLIHQWPLQGHYYSSKFDLVSNQVECYLKVINKRVFAPLNPRTLLVK